MARINQRHVAKMLNISQATVSRAIHGGAVSEETRRQVYETCEQLGYKMHYTAQSLASGRTGNIVYAIEAFTDMSGEGTHNQLIGSGEVALAADYKLSISVIDNVPGLAASGFMDGALVSIHTPAKHQAFMDWARHTEFPIVLVDAPVDEPGIANVRVDHWQAGYDLAEHVLSLGHRDVVFFGLVDKAGICVERYEGFLAAVQKTPGAQSRVIRMSHWIGRPESVLEMRNVVEDLVRMPTAFMASSDACAIGLIQLLGVMGLGVPGDVSVTGFGNSRWSGVMTPLTTLDLQGRLIGKTSMETLLRLLTGGRRRSTRKVTGAVIQRTSCMPLNEYAAKGRLAIS